MNDLARIQTIGESMTFIDTAGIWTAVTGLGSQLSNRYRVGLSLREQDAPWNNKRIENTISRNETAIPQ